MILEIGKKTQFLLKIAYFSLGAKFNRFFIILGGGRKTDQKITVFGGFGSPIYWDLDQKTTKNADEVSGFLKVFLIRYIRGIRPDIRENGRF